MDQATAAIYRDRMLKLRVKLEECGLYTTGLVDASFVPQQFIDVGWGGKETENVALFGNVLALSRCTSKPEVVFDASDEFHYTIMAFDADFCGFDKAGAEPNPSDTEESKRAPYLIWCRMNVSGDLQYASGKDVVRWQPALPHIPPGTITKAPAAALGSPLVFPTRGALNHLHRVYVLVFHQEKGEIDLSTIPIVSKASKEGRASFDINAFKAKHGLGAIIGANCCRFGYDPAVVVPALSLLRDKVVLDATGKKVLSEELNGVVTSFEKSAATPAPTTM